MTTQALLADKVQRYWELTRLIAEARRSSALLHDELVEAITTSGEPIDVEGLPTLRLVSRRSGRMCDLKALAEREPREFQRLLELGCLTLQDRLAQAQLEAGNLSGIHRQFSWETSSQVLVFDALLTRRAAPAKSAPTRSAP
jgi:hypothetical protein